jgi:hypothetical protein
VLDPLGGEDRLIILERMDKLEGVLRPKSRIDALVNCRCLFVDTAARTCQGRLRRRDMSVLEVDATVYKTFAEDVVVDNIAEFSRQAKEVAVILWVKIRGVAAS